MLAKTVYTDKIPVYTDEIPVKMPLNTVLIYRYFRYIPPVYLPFRYIPKYRHRYFGIYRGIYRNTGILPVYTEIPIFYRYLNTGKYRQNTGIPKYRRYLAVYTEIPPNTGGISVYTAVYTEIPSVYTVYTAGIYWPDGAGYPVFFTIFCYN